MDHPQLLQRSGRDLPLLTRRNCSTPRSASSAHKIYRPALPPSRRRYHPHLHRRLPFLRRQSLARLPQRHPPYLIFVLSSFRHSLRPVRLLPSSSALIVFFPPLPVTPLPPGNQFPRNFVLSALLVAP